MAIVRLQSPPARMSATDAGFLYLERPHAALHIGGVAIVRGPVSVPALVERIERRLPRLWRCDQRPIRAPFSIDHPAWEDDRDFDPWNHVLSHHLPEPGGDAELLDLVERLLAQPLRRDRPLWEMHVVHDLDGGRTAIFQKVHHCMIDGVAGAALFDSMLDASPDVTDRPGVPTARGRARPRRARLGDALRDDFRRQRRNWTGVLRALREPEAAREATRRLSEAARSAAKLARAELPDLPWNGPLGPERALRFTRLPMHGVRRIRGALGGTVNDVVLCVLAGGLHRYLESESIPTQGLRPTALVPVSLRGTEEGRALGNRFSAMLVPLPIAPADEASRYTATREITEDLKSRAAWSGIDSLLGVLEGLPPALVARVARSIRLGRLANLIATNVPGPREPRYLCGERVEAIYPIVPIADGMGLGLAVFSYDGALCVGLNADPALVPALDKLRLGVESAFSALLACA